MNQERRRYKQDNRRKTRRSTPLRIVGWLALTAFIGLAVLLTVDLVRSRGGGVQQPTAAPVTTRAAATAAEPHTGGGRLYLPVTEVDLGNVPFVTPVSYSFELRNVGDAPLVISKPVVTMLEGC